MAEVKVEFSREERQFIYLALKSAAEGLARSIGKQGLPLVKQAMEKQLADYRALQRKVEQW